MDHSEVKYLPKVDHAPAELDEVSMTLLKAANLIEELGGRICVMVAIDRVTGGISRNERGEKAALLLEKRLPPVPETPINRILRHAAKWSDATPTAEVLAKLRAVAFSS